MKILRVMVLLAACAAVAPGAAVSETTVARQALDAVLAADGAFAALSLDRGQQVAFQQYLAPGGIVFRPGPVIGRDWLATHEQPSGRLEWTAAAGAVACNGQIAVTTGPWTYENPEGGDVAAGHYLSVWRREPDGAWRVALDQGIDHAPDAAPSVSLQAALAALWPELSVRACRAGRGADALAAAERDLDAAIRAKGLAAALRRCAADGALGYRDGLPPGPLAGVAEAADAAFTEGSAATPQAVIAEAGSNLGYTYGEIVAPVQGMTPAARTIYVRLWRADGRRWRLALDMTTAIGPRPGDP